MARPQLIRVIACIVAVGFGACGQTRQSTPTTPTGPTPPPPGPSAPGEVVIVSSTAELRTAIEGLASGQTIALTPGVYTVPGDAFYLPEPLSNVTIAGASGKRDDAVVRGGRFGFWVNRVSGLTIRDLTIEGASDHGIILNCEAQAPTVRNVVLRDIGDQFIKANPGPGGCGVDDGVVEDSLFEYTHGAPDDYTNGVDVHFGANWTIRRNTFRGFFTSSGDLVGPAVLMWNGSRDSVVEDNTFVDNVRDIALGLDPTKPQQPPVSNASLTDHRSGRVSRNTITRRPGLPGADAAISVADSPETRIEANTVTMTGTYPNAIEYRFPRTTGVLITGNSVDAAIQARDGATATLSGNTTR